MGEVSDEDIKVYHEQRASHIEILKSECSAYDKAILQLGAGAIGVSIAFLDKIIPKGSVAKRPCVILAAWICLAFSMMITVGSYLVSQRKLRLEIDELDESYKAGKPPEADRESITDFRIPDRLAKRLNEWLGDETAEVRLRKILNWWLRPRVMNPAAGVLLVVGVLLLVSFAWLNLPQ